MSGKSDVGREIEPLTGRQREVLDLIARGYTNPQIADALGVSIDGAKWHVREILSKLGVDSREEAAEWWRSERSVGVRVRRATRSAVGLGVLRWVAGGAAVALVGALAVVAVMAARGDGQELVGPEVTATVGASATGTGTPAPAEGILGNHDGIPVYELVYVTTPVQLQAASLLYFVDVCGVCNGGPLYRWYETAPGTWKAEALPYDGPDIPAGYPLGSPISDGNGRLAVGWCLSEFGSCDKHFEGFQTVPRVVIWSVDGGLTWGIAGTLAAGAVPAGFADGAVIVASTISSDILTTYHVLPSGEAWTPPPGWEPADTRNATVGPYTVVYEDPSGGGLAYPPSTLLRLTDDPTAPYVAFAGGDLRALTELPDGRLLGIGSRDSKATLTADPDRELGHVLLVPVLVDVDARTISPLAGPTDLIESSFIGLVELTTGPFARVATPGSCLNVREKPSTAAATLGCFADGVLLYDLDETAGADGETWLRVKTPDQRDGWASLEFLERLR